MEDVLAFLSLLMGALMFLWGIYKSVLGLDVGDSLAFAAVGLVIFVGTKVITKKAKRQ